LKNITQGLITLFNAAPGGVNNSFWTAVNGRLFDTEAPDNTELPFAVYFVVSDVDEDTFSENMKEVYVQFSLFSDKSSSAEIKDMDTHLTSLFKDKVFTVSGWTVVTTKRVAGNGPHVNPADVEAGTGRYWQTDVDFQITVSKD
jgi:hypothetical protein